MVGDGIAANGVTTAVGSSDKAVGGADGVSVYAACAATVCATAVWMAVSCEFPDPQAERSSDEITMEVNSMYLICLNIFFLS
jgi:hypothetical protein